MKREVNTKTERRKLNKSFAPFYVCFLLIFPVLFSTACNELQKTKTEPFYAQKVEPPPVQEFRWSNGKMPKSFDPAFAAAAPETDIVRAIYEGLTDLEPKKLTPVSAVATKWTSSEDYKTWTFYLRHDAKWSNGETVTAKDFVRSWKRLIELGDKVPQRNLLKNIVGMDTENILPVFPNTEIDVLSKSKDAEKSKDKDAEKFLGGKKAESNSSVKSPKIIEPKTEKINPPPAVDNFGVEAVNDFTLKVSLVQPDANFPALVAHPVFRPVYENGKNLTNGLNANIVTNGAFRINSAGSEGVALDRADFYWNAEKVLLEKVRFVPMDNAENALAAYRAGEIDALTNADFEPLALKLLTPYADFRQVTHGALNFYEFNLSHKPFNDRRVREALAVAIERERLTDDEMDGVTEPALGFSPFDTKAKLLQDVAAAQSLLASAGFPGGKDFPPIRLLVNRNNIQQRIARAVARMWKKNLNIETEIIVKDQGDFEASYQNGEFDIARRGVVLPTTDETANMIALFPPKPDNEIENIKDETKVPDVSVDKPANSQNLAIKPNLPQNEDDEEPPKMPSSVEIAKNETILTEQQALDQLPAIPLYFPTSYSLVKPYVQGFDSNTLDTPSLKNVTINSNWQPVNQKTLSNNKN